MTRNLFEKLNVYREAVSPDRAAMNMAIDEALLETATLPTLRFYRWNRPALSFGYFGSFDEVANYSPERDLVRRWTGGGIVFHGEDLTYSMVVPASSPVFNESAMSIYEKVHHALRQALVARGYNAVVAAVTDRGAGIGVAGSNECFASPVRADVMLDRRKVAGAAQRRTRRGLLQQGSIQGFDIDDDFPERFVNALANTLVKREIAPAVLDRARAITADKYGTEAWLRKR